MNKLVVCSIGGIMGGYTTVRTYRFEKIKGEESRWCLTNHFDEVVTVTHWMPLPEPPKDTERGEK